MYQSWDGTTLLELCERCGFATPADYVLWPGIGAVVTKAGERKLTALAQHDFALAEAVFEASGRQIAAVLASSNELPRRLRRRGEKLLREDRSSGAGGKRGPALVICAAD
jgi:hypothetical protein